MAPSDPTDSEKRRQPARVFSFTLEREDSGVFTRCRSHDGNTTWTIIILLHILHLLASNFLCLFWGKLINKSRPVKLDVNRLHDREKQQQKMLKDAKTLIGAELS